MADQSPTNKLTKVLSYDLPNKWRIDELNEQLLVNSPSEDLTMHVLQLPRTQNKPSEIALSAWKKVSPDVTLEVSFEEPELSNQGWEAQHHVELVGSNNNVYQATLLIGQKEVYAILLKTTPSEFDKRYAEISLFLNSIHLSGYKAPDYSSLTAKALDANDIKNLQSFIAQSASTLSVPGVAFAISQGGKVVFEGGTGFTNTRKQQPVDAKTQFMIASNTKGMTTLLLAKLVELGKLSWEDRVIDHFPTFKLGNSKTTEQILVKHLVCACTGLPRKDFNWMFANTKHTPASSVFDDLAQLEPTSELGELYQYNNQMAAAAGYIAGHVLYPDMPLDEAYDTAMQHYVFEPLHMNDTGFSFNNALRSNFASPHDLDIYGNIIEVHQNEHQGFNHTITPYRPAGGAWSNVSDMLRYAQNELDKGQARNKKRAFNELALLQRRANMITYDVLAHYGMGLAKESLFGLEIIQHGGSLVGYKSDFYVIEQAGIAAVIMVNSTEGQPLLKAFLHKLLELVYERKGQAQSMVKIAKEKQQMYTQEFISYIDSSTNQSIKNNLAPAYKNEALGVITFDSQTQKIRINSGQWQAEYTTISSDGTSKLVFIDPVLKGLELEVGNDNAKRTLTLHGPQHRYVFYEM
ncbi:hypothetical protein PA25_36030 [Pseudoalteromonas sp. A25]|nr:hypothetical protein PA25_36030 [Pseudoalteromonas sp. A25]